MSIDPWTNPHQPPAGYPAPQQPAQQWQAPAQPAQPPAWAQPQQPPQPLQQPNQPAPAQTSPLSSLADKIANAGGVPSVFTKYSQPGETVTGVIDEVTVQHHRDYESGEPQYWDDGSPQEQIRIVLRTDLRDPAKPEDDGKRGVYVKWWGDQRRALLDAVKASGDTDIRPGGVFTATYQGEKPNEKNPRLNPIKVYAFAYQRPGAGIAASLPQPAPAPVAQAPAPQGYAQPAPAAPAPLPQAPAPLPAAPAPAPAPVTQPAGADSPEAKIRQLLAVGGFDDATIAAAAAVPVEQVAAIRAGG